MSTHAGAAIAPADARKAFLVGLAIAIAGAILFSTKAIVAKLITISLAWLRQQQPLHSTVCNLSMEWKFQ